MSQQIELITTKFKKFYLVCFLALSMGIPLIFSSITRSVFEVNKLLFLRIVMIILCGAWLLKSCLLKDNGHSHKDHESYSLFGFKWRRIGLEIPILLWIITNIISIIISRNIFISLIGAYDRWEGLATILNYVVLLFMTAKLIDNNRYRIIIFCISLFSTSVSAFYGVIQSLGIDFMRWSTDPVARVFACINNPVHFCAYVAMIVPIGISLSHYFLKKLNPSALTKLAPNYFKYIYGVTSFIYGLLSMGFLHTFSSVTSASSLIAFTLLLISLGVILYSYKSIIPGKKTVVQFLGILSGSILLFAFKAFPFDFFHLITLTFGVGLLYCLRAMGNKHFVLYRISTVCSLLCFYAMLLSFSRASIIGYTVCLAIFYQLILSHQSQLKTLGRLISLIIGTFLIQLFLIFKVQLMGFTGSLLMLFITLFSFSLIYYSSCTTFSWNRANLKQTLVSLILFCAYVMLYLSFEFIKVNSLYLSLLVFGLTIYLKSHIPKAFLKNCLCVFIFLNLLFYFSYLSHIILFFILLALLYNYILKSQFSSEENFHVLFLLISKAIIFCLPLAQIIFRSLLDIDFDLSSSYILFSTLTLFVITITILWISFKKFSMKLLTIILAIFVLGIGLGTYLQNNSIYLSSQYQKDSLKVAKTIQGRMTNLSHANARLYMWLSVPAWSIDNPLFGSGPDTIRHLYPVYRHPEYGLHEGGHNFTPDRLHNEYLNTLATNGILGFVIKYILLIGGWYILMLRLFTKYFNTSKRYILAGIIVAPGIYLVQTLFNFGVVATLFLFYFLLGIGLSFINDEYNYNETA